MCGVTISRSTEVTPWTPDVGELADAGDLAQHPAEALARLDVGGVQPQAGERLAEARHRRRVAATVVVEHDDAPPPRVPEVVERLVGHPAGERAVADDGDDAAVPAVALELAAQLEGGREAVGVGEGGRGVRALDPVVLGLGAARIARQPSALLQVLEAVAPPGEQLVDVGLMAGVEQQDVARRVEDPVQRDGELDDAEVRAQVPAGLRDRVDDERPDLRCQLDELVLGEELQVRRRLDRGEEHRRIRLPAALRCAWSARRVEPRSAAQPA